MAYEFLGAALQCIPEYGGSHDTLEPFIEQVEFFARKLPAVESQRTLINIIILKLIGYAREQIKNIRASTWNETKTNLKILLRVKSD